MSPEPTRHTNGHAVAAGILIAILGAVVLSTAKMQVGEVVHEVRSALGFILMFMGLATAMLGLGPKK